MIIMISSQGTTLECQPNPRFGRTSYFIKYDIETQNWEAYPNQAVNQRGGAGVAASQFLIDHHVDAAISGRFGPNAHQALKSAGIKMLTFNDHQQTIADVIDAYQNDQLEEVK